MRVKITDDMLTQWFQAEKHDPICEGLYETRTANYPKSQERKFENGEWKFFANGFGWMKSDFRRFKGAEFRLPKEKYHG